MINFSCALQLFQFCVAWACHSGLSVQSHFKKTIWAWLKSMASTCGCVGDLREDLRCLVEEKHSSFRRAGQVSLHGCIAVVDSRSTFINNNCLLQKKKRSGGWGGGVSVPPKIPNRLLKGGQRLEAPWTCLLTHDLVRWRLNRRQDRARLPQPLIQMKQGHVVVLIIDTNPTSLPLPQLPHKPCQPYR